MFMHKIIVAHLLIGLSNQANLTGVERELSILKAQVSSLRNKTSNLQIRLSLQSSYCSLLTPGRCGPCACIDDSLSHYKYYCDCRVLKPKSDCLEYYQNGLRVNGIYRVTQNFLKTVDVFCDQTTDGGGWTVFQRRIDGSMEFYRDWETYKNGFGKLNNEFWFGNENIHTMLLQVTYPLGSELRIDMETFEKQKYFAKYNKFQLGNEFSKYILHVGGYTGDAGDGMTTHTRLMFSTYDRDNDHDSSHCARVHATAWWMNACHPLSDLNGHYIRPGKTTHKGINAKGVNWYPLRYNWDLSLKMTEMKLRRRLK